MSLGTAQGALKAHLLKLCSNANHCGNMIQNGHILVWNQGLVNLDFDDNKTRFKTNDYISSVIRQDNFQSGNYKDKSS